MRLIISITFFYFLSGEINSQGCCSGGSGSPIVVGSSKGVLQVASQFQITVGASFRFYAYKTGLLNGNQVSATYVCPMHPEETSTGRSKCKKCGMYLEKIK